MLKIKQLIVFTISLALASTAIASRIHVVSPSARPAIKQLKGQACRPITLKNHSYETLHVTIRYIDGGMDEWYLDPSQVVDIDMENDEGDCDKGAFINIETLDHYQIFSDYVKAGRNVVIDPYQLKFLRS